MFTIYYFFCGVGAALVYLGTLSVYSYLISGSDFRVWGVPVVGASGSIFGLFLSLWMVFWAAHCIFYDDLSHESKNHGDLSCGLRTS